MKFRQTTRRSFGLQNTVSGSDQRTRLQTSRRRTLLIGTRKGRVDAPCDCPRLFGSKGKLADMKTRLPNHSLWITRVVLMAFLGRVVLLLFLEFFTDFPLIPDESQYDIAARAVVNGETSTFWGEYGKDFLWSLQGFMKPLSVAYWFYSDPIVGRLLSLGCSLVSIIFIYKSLRQLVPERYARFGTIIYLVIPSINIWAVTVMRESQIHMLLILSMYITIKIFSSSVAREWVRVAQGGVALSLIFCVLGFSRVQTLIPLIVFGVFALSLSLALRSRYGAQTAVLGLLSLLVATLVSGVGAFGIDLIRGAVPQLGQIQTRFSVEAESGFIGGREIPQTITVEPLYEATSGPMQVIERNGTEEIVYNGKIYEVDNSWSHQLSVFPERLVAAMFRPFIWEASGSFERRVSSIENLFWIMSIPTLILCLFLGSLHRINWVVPLLAVALLFAFFASFALTQGNLGTIFRHRGQLYGCCIVGISVVASEIRPSGSPIRLCSKKTQNQRSMQKCKY